MPLLSANPCNVHFHRPPGLCFTIIGAATLGSLMQTDQHFLPQAESVREVDTLMFRYLAALLARLDRTGHRDRRGTMPYAPSLAAGYVVEMIPRPEILIGSGTVSHDRRVTANQRNQNVSPLEDHDGRSHIIQ